MSRLIVSHKFPNQLSSRRRSQVHKQPHVSVRSFPRTRMLTRRRDQAVPNANGFCTTFKWISDVSRWLVSQNSWCFLWKVLFRNVTAPTIVLFAFFNPAICAGVTFAADGQGMLGVGYLKTPLGKVNATDNRNFWTLVLESGSFQGPVGYFLPG